MFLLFGMAMVSKKIKNGYEESLYIYDIMLFIELCQDGGAADGAAATGKSGANNNSNKNRR